MIGIYKITSPVNKIYVGQSVDIPKRWKQYKGTECKQQIKLNRSFKKYGINNHKFEIIEECSLEQIDERELYWGIFYNVLGENGLNLRLGEGRGKCSDETKLKKSLAMKGKKQTEEHKNKRFQHVVEYGDKISLSKQKAIIKINLNTGETFEYPSVSEANISLGKRIGDGSIGEVCNGKRKSCYGFGWRWKN
jgi:group I intron endonuclease